MEQKHIYSVYTEYGELLAEVSGKLRHISTDNRDFPAVGDWVAIAARPEEGKATIHGIIPRKSKFSRKLAGVETQEQIIAANIDTIFIVSSLNRDFNIRRIERYLIMAWESGAQPVIVLNKADLCTDVEEKIELLQSIAFGVPIHPISAVTGQGLGQLERYLGKGSTVSLTGSSGVGKSTLTNSLAGQNLLEVQEIREDDARGRHTTTHRELVVLPSGALIIDTPGMREFQLWDGAEGIQGTFEDIEALAKQCRFRDCSHESEPGCAVKRAVSDGILGKSRYESYKKLQKELTFIEAKQNQLQRLQEKRNRKSLTKMTRG